MLIEQEVISRAKYEQHTMWEGQPCPWAAVLIQHTQVFNRSGSGITGPLGQERLMVDEGSLDL